MIIKNFTEMMNESNSDSDKKETIKKHVEDMLDKSLKDIKNNIDKVFESDAVDINGWDQKHNNMLLPKAIVIAILEREAEQYSARGTSHEKYIKKEVNNIKKFI